MIEAGTGVGTVGMTREVMELMGHHGDVEALGRLVCCGREVNAVVGPILKGRQGENDVSIYDLKGVFERFVKVGVAFDYSNGRQERLVKFCIQDSSRCGVSDDELVRNFRIIMHVCEDESKIGGYLREVLLGGQVSVGVMNRIMQLLRGRAYRTEDVDLLRQESFFGSFVKVLGDREMNVGLRLLMWRYLAMNRGYDWMVKCWRELMNQYCSEDGVGRPSGLYVASVFNVMWGSLSDFRKGEILEDMVVRVLGKRGKCLVKSVRGMVTLIEARNGDIGKGLIGALVVLRAKRQL